jgi:membrane protease YdiL (CAAX protease family)
MLPAAALVHVVAALDNGRAAGHGRSVTDPQIASTAQAFSLLSIRTVTGLALARHDLGRLAGGRRSERETRRMDRSSVVGDAGLVAAIVGFHVVDHRYVDRRFHVVTHASAGIAAVGAAAALGASVDDLGMDPARFRSAVRAGLLAGALPVLGVAASIFVPALEPVLADPRAEHDSRAELAYRLALDIPIGTALYEELVFRSALLSLARRRWSDPAAIAITSAAFGLWHVLPALEDRQHNSVAQRYPLVATVAPTVLSTAIAGAWFAVLRQRAGHVIAPMIAHASVNAAGLLAASIANRRRSRAPSSSTERTAG